MESSSPSFVVQKHEVFISYRGEDTRHDFIIHLFVALEREGIKTFFDDEFAGGEEITTELLTAIEESKISIILLSKNYAFSSWSLEELCVMLECKERNGQKVVPIFYYVDPSDVCNQRGSFEEAFAKHEESFKDGTDKVEKWKSALNEVGSLSGYLVQDNRPEWWLIKDIVKFINVKLNSLQQKFKVFLSSGEDTCNNFTSYLDMAFKRKGIETFVGYRFERGKELSPEHLKAIEDSKVLIIVLSENYASSSWCLDELCMILECKKRNGQMVVPVFYYVDPSYVQKQTGSFEEAFANRQERLRDRTDKVDSWRAALAEVGNLNGFYLDTTQNRPEADFIEDIVKDIWAIRNCKLPSDAKGLVGMDSRIQKLEELLDHMEFDVVRIIGMWGMPGVGKTTTAVALFKHISSQFDASYFLADVREKSIWPSLECVRNELFSELLKENLEIGTASIRGTFVSHWLRCRKILIVLDDVNNSQQVEYLLGDWSCFGPGSIIIITSRDKRVLQGIVDIMYEVQKLTYDQALELFIQYAFRANHSTSIAERRRSSARLVHYAEGIPLALKILGSILWNEKERTWDNALRSSEKDDNKKLHEMLRISYDELEDDEKRIFLDVACFFKGEDKDHVADILDGCGFSTDVGIYVLVCKSLITIVNNKLQMHNLIQEMGWEIIHQESEYPGKRSRLWICKDIIDVLTTNKGTDMVEGIFLNMLEIEKPICINSEAFLGMHNLRLLKIYNPHFQEDYKVHLPANDLDELPTYLVYLHWHCCPLKSLPLKFRPKNLVELHMHYSHVIRLWEGTPKLQKLKWIDLSYSQHLKEMPDLSKAPNLVRITLIGCTSLLEIPSIAGSLPNLQAVYLSGCSNLKNFPLLSWNVEELHLDGTAIEEVPSEIQHFSRLVKLNMENCKRLKNLPSIHCKLRSLEFLDLSGCLSLIKFPEISWNLKTLLLNENAITELPSSIEFLGNLVSLKLQNCMRIKYLPSSISKLKSLEFLYLSGCTRLEFVPELPPNLQYLDAHDCTSLEAESSSFPISCGRSQRFIFTNCINLDQNTIWAKTQLSIQQRATADVKLYHKDEKQGLRPGFSSICICFPGSEIPEWFNCQNLGSSVTIQLPPYLHDHRFVGFALCVVVAFKDYNEYLGFSIECQCNFKTKGDDCHDCLSCFSGWDKSDSPRYIGSHHVFLGYDFNLYSDWYSEESKYYLNEASFKFHTYDSDSSNPLDSCIFKCGVCLLYAQEEIVDDTDIENIVKY